MAITFPGKDGREDGDLFYVPDSDLVLEWSEDTSSWNIVGPDNLATTDYVDQTIATDATKTARNSALHAATNVINIDATRSALINTGCRNSATSSFAGDHQYAPGGDFQLPAEEWNDAAHLHATKGTVPEWADCNDGLPAGTFTFVGHDLVTSNYSAEYQYILGISISKFDSPGVNADFGRVVPGDTLEVFIDTTARAGGAGTAIKFALYEVVDVYDLVSTIAFGVIFRESNTPEESILTDFTYQLQTYGSTLEKTGGTVTGDVKVVSDSNSAFSVWRNTEDIQFEDNPYNLVFNIDSTLNNVYVNEKYIEALEIPYGESQAQIDPLSVATVGYVNGRLGMPKDERNLNEDGPFLRVVGGDVGRELGLKVTNSALGGFQNFVIYGVTDNPAVGDQLVLTSMNNAANDNKTEINYYGPSRPGTNNITTVNWVNDRFDDERPDLSVFVRHDGTVSLTGRLSFANSNLHSKEIHDYNDDELVAAKAVKAIQVATVFNGPTNGEGELFQEGGALYYNVYFDK